MWKITMRFLSYASAAACSCTPAAAVDDSFGALRRVVDSFVALGRSSTAALDTLELMAHNRSCGLPRHCRTPWTAQRMWTRWRRWFLRCKTVEKNEKVENIQNWKHETKLKLKFQKVRILEFVIKCYISYEFDFLPVHPPNILPSTSRRLSSAADYQQAAVPFPAEVRRFAR